MNQDQAEAERVAREIWREWSCNHFDDAASFLSLVAAAILAAEEMGKRSRDDEVSKLVGKIDDLRSECLRAYSNGD